MKRISVTTSVWTWNDVYSPLSSRDSTRVVFIRTRIGLGETWFGWILHGGPSKYIHVISVGSWRTVSLLSLLYSRLPKNYPRVSKPRYTWTEIISLLENSMVLGDLPMVSLAPHLAPLTLEGKFVLFIICLSFLPGSESCQLSMSRFWLFTHFVSHHVFDRL